MEGKAKPTLAELRVGIFVLVTGIVLAVAIFTIGSQYGLLGDTFEARTYLSNVSGLKPGDLVMLGGKEVGNIREVTISAKDRTPIPAARQEALDQLDLLNLRLQRLMADNPTDEQLQQLKARASEAESLYGLDSPEAQDARQRHESARVDRQNLDNLLQEIRTLENLHDIQVDMDIALSYKGQIKLDSAITLGSIGLLGDKYIEISLGRSNLPPLSIWESADPLLGFIGDDMTEVVLITGQPSSGFQELITGANDILANFETLSSSLVEVIDQLQKGEGSIGKFISDDTLYENLNDTVRTAQTAADEAARMLRNINEGEGTIPALIQKRELYDRINSTVASLDQAMAKLNTAEGTLGRLINDRSLYDKSDKMLGNVEQVTRRMAAGEGTLGKLSTDEKLYVELQEAVDQLGRFMADIEAGKGTLGRLAKDEQLYQNVNELSSEVVKLIYDFRQNPKKFLTIKFELF